MRVQRVATQGKGKPQPPPDPVLTCANPGCRATFIPVRKWQKYHSSSCRFQAWNRLKALREPAVASAKAGHHWSRRKHSPPRPTAPSKKPEASVPKRRLTVHCVVVLY